MIDKISYLTFDELDDMQHQNFPRDAYFIVCGVSQSQFSVARHCGGCKIKGYSFTYFAETDELIRDDILKWVTKRRKSRKPKAHDKNKTLPIPEPTK